MVFRCDSIFTRYHVHPSERPSSLSCHSHYFNQSSCHGSQAVIAFNCIYSTHLYLFCFGSPVKTGKMIGINLINHSNHTIFQIQNTFLPQARGLAAPRCGCTWTATAGTRPRCPAPPRRCSPRWWSSGCRSASCGSSPADSSPPS